MKRLFVSLPMKGKTEKKKKKGIREAYEKVKTLYPYEEIELMERVVSNKYGFLLSKISRQRSKNNGCS